MEVLVEKREEFLTAGYVVFRSYDLCKLNQNIVKTRLLFPTKRRDAECSREVSMILFVDIECIDNWWIFDCRVSSVLNNRAREPRFLQYAEAERIHPQQKRNII